MLEQKHYFKFTMFLKYAANYLIFGKENEEWMAGNEVPPRRSIFDDRFRDVAMTGPLYAIY